MSRLSLCFLFLLMAIALVEGGPHKPMKVKCKDKKFPTCYHKDLFCPADCLRTCVVDCGTCQPVCTPPPPPPPSPPPPPPKVKKPKSPPPPPKVKTPKSPPPPPKVKSPPPPKNPDSPPLPPPPPSSGSPPPPSDESAGKRVKCKNLKFPHCYGIELTCPSTCPGQCEVDCVTCSPVCSCNKPGAVCQDPRFIGGDGITFYFHGKKDRDFCLVTDPNLHINAHFIGRQSPNMTRDFTWIQSLGILFDNHIISISSLKTSTWHDANDRLSLTFDSTPIILRTHEGAAWRSDGSPLVTIRRTRNTNSVEIEVEDNFKIKADVVPITEKESLVHNYGINTLEDCFAHLDVGFKFYKLSGDVNGVLGQTYARNYVSRVKMGVDMPVLGGEKEFASSSLYATDCVASKFSSGITLSRYDNDVVEYVDMDCSSKIGGRGVVCKK